MKSFSKYLMLLVLLALSSFSKAEEVFEELPALQVRFMQTDSALRGLYVSVLYVNGRVPGISFGDKKQFYVRRVISQETKQISNPKSVINFNDKKIELEGFYGSYNYVLLVLHRQSKYVWRNLDENDLPILPVALKGIVFSKDSSDSLHVQRVSRKELEGSSQNPFIVEME